MGDKSLRIKEKQVSQELNTVFATYAVDELDRVEILVFTGFLKDLGQQFRYIHAELESDLGDQYGTAYPNFEQTCKKIIDTTKCANARLRKLVLEDQLKAAQEQAANLKNALKIREQIFQDKLSRAISDIDSDDMDGIRESCHYLNSLLDEFYGIFRDVKVAYGSDDYVWF